MDNRKITLAIPTWNRYDLTVQCIQSTLYDDRVSEIVLVDDCSTDDSYSRLVLYCMDKPKVKLYRNDHNLDCYRNKKEAISKATNEWCIIFDSDNGLPSEYIDTLFSIDEWDERIAYQPSFARPHFDFRPHMGKVFDSQNVYQYTNTNLMTAFNAMNYFINRDEYLRIWDGSIDPVTSDSIYMNYCWLLAGNKVYVVPGLEYDHLVHKGHYQENVHKTPKGFHNDIVNRIYNLKDIVNA